MKKIGIIGAGSWGTALSMLLNAKGNEVTLWAFLEEEAESMKATRKHKDLANATIDPKIMITNDMKDAVKGKEIILIVVPSNFMRQNVEKLKEYVTDDQILVNCTKGIEEDTLLTMTQVISEILPKNEVATLSGPSHAEEVAVNNTTTCIIASKQKQTALMLQDLFTNDKFRVYINPDLIGVELGGSLKNIIALASGICDGIGLGDNAKAALITRGLVEISRLGVAMGADLKTFYGLSGLGDLIVTCNSMHSRNRRCGIMLGEGKTLDEARQKIGMIIEGVSNAKMGYELSKKYKVSAPIIESVNRIIFEGADPKEEELRLMNRSKKQEFDAEMNMFNDIKWKGEQDVCR